MDAALQAGIPIVELSAGDTLYPSENVTIRIHESAAPEYSVNDLSMLVEFEYFGCHLLYTGDLSTKGEPVELPDIDILKIPHHGSASATSERLLYQTSPEIAIISVGDNNYGHPSDKTLQRLHAVGADVYRTDQCGAIEVHISQDGEMKVHTYLPYEGESK